jgi:hypothetical protein
MTNAMPCRIVPTPRVTINGLIRKSRTRRPFVYPSRAPQTRPTRIASVVLCQSRATMPVTMPMKAYWPPMERSTLPEIRSAVIPMAATPIDVTESSVMKKLSAVRKFGYLNPSPR